MEGKRKVRVAASSSSVFPTASSALFTRWFSRKARAMACSSVNTSPEAEVFCWHQAVIGAASNSDSAAINTFRILVILLLIILIVSAPLESGCEDVKLSEPVPAEGRFRYLSH
jgi:hypothetical protein